MNHKWKVISVDGKTLQQCVRCGLLRVKETSKTLMVITPTPPYYHYKYESVWAYMYDGKKTLHRPVCKLLSVKNKRSDLIFS